MDFLVHKLNLTAAQLFVVYFTYNIAVMAVILNECINLIVTYAYAGSQILVKQGYGNTHTHIKTHSIFFEIGPAKKFG